MHCTIKKPFHKQFFKQCNSKTFQQSGNALSQGVSNGIWIGGSACSNYDVTVTEQVSHNIEGGRTPPLLLPPRIVAWIVDPFRARTAGCDVNDERGDGEMFQALNWAAEKEGK